MGLLVAGLLLFGPMGASGQEEVAPRIEVGPDRHVDVPVDPTLLLVEPHLAAHPSDPKRLLGAAMVTSPLGADAGDVHCVLLRSRDGGASWSTRSRVRPSHGGACFDPWLAIRADGTALFAALVGGELHVYPSTDGGDTWSETPVVLGTLFDHPTMAVDRTRGPRAGDFWVIGNRARRVGSHVIEAEPHAKGRYSSFVARFDGDRVAYVDSADVILTNLNNQTLTPVVLSDGSLVFPVLELQRKRISADGEFLGHEFLDRNRTWIQRSSDGAASFSPPLFVSEECGVMAHWPVMASDASGGPFHDRLYLLCAREDFRGLLLFRSPDHGERWTDPVEVQQLPVGDVPYTRTQAIAVNRDGVVGVTWADGRGHGDGDCLDIYFTASLDGGASFLPERRVSSESSCPHTGPNGWAAERFTSGGDYTGLVAGAGGDFHLLWADSRSDRFRLRAATVRVHGEVRRGSDAVPGDGRSSPDADSERQER